MGRRENFLVVTKHVYKLEQKQLTSHSDRVLDLCKIDFATDEMQERAGNGQNIALYLCIYASVQTRASTNPPIVTKVLGYTKTLQPQRLAN